MLEFAPRFTEIVKGAPMGARLSILPLAPFTHQRALCQGSWIRTHFMGREFWVSLDNGDSMTTQQIADAYARRQDAINFELHISR